MFFSRRICINKLMLCFTLLSLITLTLAVPTTQNQQQNELPNLSRGLFDFMSGSGASPSPSPIDLATQASPLPTPSISPSITADASPSPVESEMSPESPTPYVTPTASIVPTPSEMESPDVSPIVTPTASVSPMESMSLLPSPSSEEESVVDDEEDGLRSRPMDGETVVEPSPSPSSALLAGADEGSSLVAPKSDPGATTVAGTGAGGFSMIALIAIALAILAPAVLIYWGIRRRNSGFENMPAVATESNLYRGQNARGNFSVSDE